MGERRMCAERTGLVLVAALATVAVALAPSVGADHVQDRCANGSCEFHDELPPVKAVECEATPEGNRVSWEGWDRPIPTEDEATDTAAPPRDVWIHEYRLVVFETSDPDLEAPHLVARAQGRSEVTSLLHADAKPDERYAYVVEYYAWDNRPPEWGEKNLQGLSPTTLASACTVGEDRDDQAPPTGLACTAEDGRNRLTWDAAEGAAEYQVWRAEDGGDFFVVGTTTGTGFVDRGVAPGVEYRYKVSASSGQGVAFSGACAVTAVAKPPTAPAPVALAGAALDGKNGTAIVVADVRLDVLGAAEGDASLGAAAVDGPRLAGATVLGAAGDATRVWLRFENVTAADVIATPDAEPLQLDYAEHDPDRGVLALDLNVSLGAALAQADDAAVATDGPMDAAVLSAWGGAPDARLTLANVTGDEVFVADFHGFGGGEWWVQVQVDGNRGIWGVEARVDNGSWRPLDDKGWGWAASIHAPPGSEVQFRARSDGGALAVSEPVAWPPG